MLMLSGCFQRDVTPTDVPTPDTQETGTVIATSTGEVASWTTDTSTGTDTTATDTGSLETGFNTKDFSDPEVEEVIDLLEGMLKS